jgi:putative flavoprotein involved in K+ transport
MRTESDITHRSPAGPGRRSIDTVVIGGGQVGLTVGYHLKRQGREFLILDAGDRVGDSWRNRWDSLLLFTPARYNGLPGARFPAAASSYVDKDQMAAYLESYAERFGLPVRNRSRVRNLSRAGERFLVQTDDMTYEASNVIVAMGNSQVPRVPSFSADLDPSIVQMHSRDYRNVSQLAPGKVLVVGVGNSGADISIEVARTHPTVLAGKETAHVPFRIETFIARHLLIKLVRFLGHHVLTVRTPVGRKVRPKLLTAAAPLVRVKPKDIDAAGIERVGRITGVTGGKPVTEDGTALDVRNVIWCTGWRPGFSWIDLPIFGDRQEPVHERGIVESEPGLYFVGLHFLYSITSETITGHQRDAKRITDHLAARSPVRKPLLTGRSGPGGLRLPA